MLQSVMFKLLKIGLYYSIYVSQTLSLQTRHFESNQKTNNWKYPLDNLILKTDYRVFHSHAS